MKIYLVMRNADMTEGRGPMVIDEAFLHRDHAIEYMDVQPGVMGCRGKWSEDRFGSSWEMRELNVHENAVDSEEIRKQRLINNAKAKLTPEERRALGL